MCAVRQQNKHSIPGYSSVTCQLMSGASWGSFQNLSSLSLEVYHLFNVNPNHGFLESSAQGPILPEGNEVFYLTPFPCKAIPLQLSSTEYAFPKGAWSLC